MNSIDHRRGYYNSPWPGEDGGPQRLQMPQGIPGLNIQTGEKLVSNSRRVMFGNMVVLREPGQVYMMTIEMLRNRIFRRPAHFQVERIDPLTLEMVKISPKLKGGNMWPGGFAIHKNGDLYVTYGSFCHRLDADCNLMASYPLPKTEPYNSLVILDNGYLVMKQLSETNRAVLSILDPETLQPVCEAIETIEPSISRLSSKGNTIYITGTTSIFRYHWNDTTQKAELDDSWIFDYIKGSNQSYGWDPVISEKNAWFMDNGKYKVLVSMINAGVHPTPLNYVRVSLDDKNDFNIAPISGLAKGSITNPPLYCPQKKILVAYDSANSVICAFTYAEETRDLSKIWEKTSFGCGGHMIYYQDTGEIVTNDYKRFSDSTVVLDIESGVEKGRAPLKSFSQGMVFSCPGWDRDFYYLTLSSISRVQVL
ncbi:MAG: hypothetical protein JRJ27_04180 [Deltaproteobacteria bacterium]|nr:hypothetical protein [Deltaproteobacteria bacterium]MBW2364144.1 hypothetical protein [Deltaproteobacteria bacterium]